MRAQALGKEGSNTVDESGSPGFQDGQGLAANLTRPNLKTLPWICGSLCTDFESSVTDAPNCRPSWMSGPLWVHGKMGRLQGRVGVWVLHLQYKLQTIVNEERQSV